jgi:hypothetical protein
VDKQYDRDQIFDEERRSDFLWCLHCERTYNRGNYRKVGDLQMCPYPDCDGSTVMDGWDWEEVRDEHSDYPVVPKDGVRYPLYPDAESGSSDVLQTSEKPDLPSELSEMFGPEFDTNLTYRNKKERKRIQDVVGLSGGEPNPRLKKWIEAAAAGSMEAQLRSFSATLRAAVRAETTLIRDEDFPENDTLNTEVNVYAGSDDADDVFAHVQSKEVADAIIAAIDAAVRKYFQDVGVAPVSLHISHELSGYGGN